MKVEYSAPTAKKKADAQKRIGKMTLIAESDREEIFLAWLRLQLSWATLQNFHYSSNQLVTTADEPPTGLFQARSVKEAYRLKDEVIVENGAKPKRKKK